jgi:hypothetical protein
MQFQVLIRLGLVLTVCGSPCGLHLHVSCKNVPPVGQPHPQFIAVALNGYLDTIERNMPWHTQKLDSSPVWLYSGGLQPEPECGGYHLPERFGAMLERRLIDCPARVGCTLEVDWINRA